MAANVPLHSLSVWLIGHVGTLRRAERRIMWAWLGQPVMLFVGFVVASVLAERSFL